MTVTALHLQAVALLGGITLAAVLAVCTAFARSRDDDAFGCALLIVGVVAAFLVLTGLGVFMVSAP